MKKYSLISLLTIPIMTFSGCALDQIRIPDYSFANYSYTTKRAHYKKYITQIGAKDIFEVKTNKGEHITFIGLFASNIITAYEINGKRFEYFELSKAAKIEIRGQYDTFYTDFLREKERSELSQISLPSTNLP